ncbi:MAG: hypothetical protein J6X78_10465, partial [Treponema sp.]|nr:hypothetical protein [Treponema sp.]
SAIFKTPENAESSIKKLTFELIFTKSSECMNLHTSEFATIQLICKLSFNLADCACGKFLSCVLE